MDCTMGMDGTGAMGVICDTVWDKLRPQDPGRVNMEICRRIDWACLWIRRG